MKHETLGAPQPALLAGEAPDEPGVSLVELLTWLGERKRLIGLVTLAVALVATVVALLLPPTFTARATLMPPGMQQQSSSAAALAALGTLGGLTGGLGAKSPDELYVALLKSDSVYRSLDQRFHLREHYDVDNFEQLRKTLGKYFRASSDKKSGLITVEVDDEDPKFAADVANAHEEETTKVLGRLAVSEAQVRRAFFESQLKETKEHLVTAEVDLQRVQERSGVIVLDKQAEALISGAAQVRALIADRQVRLKVLRGSATEQNPEVIRLSTELRALQTELARMESSQGGVPGSAVDLPVGKLPAAGVEYVRARRELKLQETLLESMIRQFEIAKLDEAKEGPQLQTVDLALPPDHKSKPSRALIVLGSSALALILVSAWVIVRRYSLWTREHFPDEIAAREALGRAWRWRA